MNPNHEGFQPDRRGFLPLMILSTTASNSDARPINPCTASFRSQNPRTLNGLVRIPFVLGGLLPSDVDVLAQRFQTCVSSAALTM